MRYFLTHIKSVVSSRDPSARMEVARPQPAASSTEVRDCAGLQHACFVFVHWDCLLTRLMLSCRTRIPRICTASSRRCNVSWSCSRCRKSTSRMNRRTLSANCCVLRYAVPFAVSVAGSIICRAGRGEAHPVGAVGDWPVPGGHRRASRHRRRHDGKQLLCPCFEHH